MAKGGEFRANSMIKNKSVRVVTIYNGLLYETYAHMDGFAVTLATTHSPAKASWNHRTWVMTAYIYSIEALSTLASLVS